MSNLKIAATAVFVTICLVSAAADANIEGKAMQKKEAPKSRKDFTKEDFIAHINGNLGRFASIIDAVPGLKKDVDSAGNVTYTYQGKRLEDLDKEQLSKLYSRISSEATRIRTERLNKQLENIRRAEQLAAQNRRVTPLPQPPKMPPQPPPTSSRIPQPPQPPTPPQAPRR